MARANNSGSSHKGMSYTKFGYIFIAPFVIAYCLFSLYPLLTTFWYSAGNLQSTTAKFWGFSNYDVYYDRYLDLTEYYSDSFEKDVGISKSDYNQIKNFFSAQRAAEMYSPLDAKGIQAIIDNGTNSYISQKTIDEVTAALNAQDIGQISPASMDELTNWMKNFSDLGVDISNKISSIKSSLDLIANPATEEEEGGETEAVTSETIITADNFQGFIDTLSSEEFTEDQQALMNYLAEKTGFESLVDYFTAVKNGEASIEDPTFYYVCANLNKPNAVTANGDSVEGISVPFIATVEEYLAANVWADMVTSLNSYSNLEAYASGAKNLHDDQETLYADLKTLNDAGIISVEVIVINGNSASVSDSLKTDNLLVAYRNYIDTNYESNPVETQAAMQIGKISTYYQNAGRAKLVSMGVDKYITYSGNFNIGKYREFKAAVGLDTTLTVAKYKELDATRKAERVAKAQEDLAAAQSKLADAQAAYNAAVGTDGEQKALNDLKTVEVAIQKAKNTIKDPKGILAGVDAKSMYIMVGLGNYGEIFKNKTRFDTVTGAMVTTAIMWVIGFVPQILLALLLSAWFTDTKLKLKGLSLMKGLMYLPNVITAVTIAIFFRRLFAYSTSTTSASPVQQFLHMMGDADGYNFFESAWATRFLVCFINFWMWYGNTMIVLIAGITSINESLYESAQIDGANSFQTYTKITMPLLRPILLYTMVTSLIGGLQMYDIPQNLNVNSAFINFNGSYIKSTRTILMYINEQAFGKQDIKAVGIASATSVLLFFTTTILSVVIFYIMRDKDAAKAKKIMKKGGTTK